MDLSLSHTEWVWIWLRPNMWMVYVIDHIRMISIYFVEEIDKFFEIDLIVRFYACYLYHSVDFVICYLFSQNFKNFLKVLSRYISFPNLWKEVLKKIV
jgi:hypothetical protein